MKMTEKQIDCLTASIKMLIGYSLAMLEPEDGGDLRDSGSYDLSDRISIALDDELRRHWWHPQTADELRQQLADIEAAAIVSPKPETIDTSARPVAGDDMRLAIIEAMATLEQMPCGGIGADGYTLVELIEAEDRGSVADGNADYHTAQRAWRILEQAITEKATQ